MLRTAFGPAIARFLDDPAIAEVMLNPDGRLWIDRLSSGLMDSGEVVSAADGSASFDWSPITRVPKFTQTARASRPSYPRQGSASRGYCRRWLRLQPSRSVGPRSRCSASMTMSPRGS